MRVTSTPRWTPRVSRLPSGERSTTARLRTARVCLVLAGCFLVLLAPQAVAQKQAQTVRDVSKFRALNNPVISADGAWMAAEAHLDGGDVIVCVWSTQSDVTFTIKRGQNPRISRDSRWVSALQKPPLRALTTTASNDKRPGRTLVLLNLQDGSRRTFDFVLSYDVTHFSSHLVYLQAPEAMADDEKPPQDGATKPAAKSAAKERAQGTLNVAELVSDRVFTWRNVTQYAAHQDTDYGNGETWKKGYAYVAFVSHDKETGRDRLEVAFVGHAKRSWGTGGIFDGGKIESLRWASDSVTLGLLDRSETTGKDGKPRVSSALYLWHDVRGRPGHRQFTQVAPPSPDS